MRNDDLPQFPDFVQLSEVDCTLHPLSTRFSITVLATSLLDKHDGDIHAAINELEDDLDDLNGEVLENLSERVDEDGDCSYCGGNVREADGSMDLCAGLAHDLTIFRSARDMLRFRALWVAMSTQNLFGWQAHLAHAEVVGGATADWTTVMAALDSYDWEGHSRVAEARIEIMKKVVLREEEDDDDDGDVA
jgi:hypothetical protein